MCVNDKLQAAQSFQDNIFIFIQTSTIIQTIVSVFQARICINQEAALNQPLLVVICAITHHTVMHNV